MLLFRLLGLLLHTILKQFACVFAFLHLVAFALLFRLHFLSLDERLDVVCALCLDLTCGSNACLILTFEFDHLLGLTLLLLSDLFQSRTAYGGHAIARHRVDGGEVRLGLGPLLQQLHLLFMFVLDALLVCEYLICALFRLIDLLLRLLNLQLYTPTPTYALRQHTASQ